MKGILFSEKYGMLSAVIENRKTMTRRLSGLEEININSDNWILIGEADGVFNFKSKTANFENNITTKSCKPRYKLNEIVYIKESHAECCDEYGTPIIAYRIDNEAHIIGKDNERLAICESAWSIDNWPGEGWTNPMFCGEKDARHFIKITAIKVERLQDINREDAAKEGVCFPDGKKPKWIQTHRWPEENFETLINLINGKHTWGNNPWVFVYEFEKFPNNG